jgi:hypothetical protein
MATGMLIKETMSGWMRLNNDAQARDFAFSIRAFTTHIFFHSLPYFICFICVIPS